MPVSARLARIVAAAFVGGCAALLGAACSNSQPVQAVAPQSGTATATTGPDGVQTITVQATDKFRFVPATINAKVGKIRIILRAVGGTPHNLSFQTLDSVSVRTTSQGQSRSVDFTVSQPGRYRFVCTIHESLDQSGTLNVTR